MYQGLGFNCCIAWAATRCGYVFGFGFLNLNKGFVCFQKVMNRMTPFTTSITTNKNDKFISFDLRATDLFHVSIDKLGKVYVSNYWNAN